MLHTLMRSPFEINMVLLMNMLKLYDDIVLLQNSVVLALKNNIFIDNLLSFSITLYVIKSDVYARGIQQKISPDVTLIDYDQFIFLVTKHKQQMSW